MTREHPARPAIVVGVDGSTSALHATRWAAREAGLRNLPLRLVHGCDPPVIRHPTTMAAQGEYVNALRHQGRHWVREAAAAAVSVVPDLDVSDRVRIGGAAEALIEESIGARLVVLGSRGLGGFTGQQVGSVALALAEHGHCPVVVVRGHALDGPPPAGGPVLVGVDAHWRARPPSSSPSTRRPRAVASWWPCTPGPTRSCRPAQTASSTRPSNGAGDRAHG